MGDLIFLKLGGSLVTDKKRPHTPRLDVIRRAGLEIKKAIRKIEGLRIVLGHGSGSFGHVPGDIYQTRKGVRTPAQWIGFVKVWQEARSLNQIIVDVFMEIGLPVIAFPPSAALISQNREIYSWNTLPMSAALENGIVPIINGDVVFDREIGGTILSTEELFRFLSVLWKPNRVLLAGIEEGVWKDFPTCKSLIERITPASFGEIESSIEGSNTVDVTGGMLEKVKLLLDIVKNEPACSGSIYSGMVPGNIENTILGMNVGTTISSYNKERDLK